jgi:hypothetical protein
MPREDDVCAGVPAELRELQVFVNADLIAAGHVTFCAGKCGFPGGQAEARGN